MRWSNLRRWSRGLFSRANDGAEAEEAGMRLQIEAEALERAKLWVGLMSEGSGFVPWPGLDPLPVAPMHPEAGHLFLQQCVKEAAKVSVDMRSQLIEHAKAGDDDVIAALDDTLYTLNSQGRITPVLLVQYDQQRRQGRIRRRGGRSKATTFWRDNSIVYLVFLLMGRFHLKATRYPYERRSRPRSRPRAPSACSILHRALNEARVFHGDEAAVNKIFDRGFRFDFFQSYRFLRQTLAHVPQESERERLEAFWAIVRKLQRRSH